MRPRAARRIIERQAERAERLAKRPLKKLQMREMSHLKRVIKGNVGNRKGRRAMNAADKLAAEMSKE